MKAGSHVKEEIETENGEKSGESMKYDELGSAEDEDDTNVKDLNEAVLSVTQQTQDTRFVPYFIYFCDVAVFGYLLLLYVTMDCF